MPTVLIRHFRELTERLEQHVQEAADPGQKEVFAELLARCESMTLGQCTPHSWSLLWTHVTKKVSIKENAKAHRLVLSDMSDIAGYEFLENNLRH